MKVEKRMLYLSENLRKIVKGVVFGHPLTYFEGGNLFLSLFVLFVCSSDGIDVEVIPFRQPFIRSQRFP